MNVFYLRWNDPNAFSKRIDSFLELLHIAVSESDVIVDIRFVGDVRLILQRLFQSADALLELAICVVGQTQLVQHLRVVLRASVLVLQPLPQVIDREVEVTLVVLALSTVHQELSVLRHHLDCGVVVQDRLVVVPQRVVAAP